MMFMNLDPVARRNLEITETIRDRNRKGTPALGGRPHHHGHGRPPAAAMAWNSRWSTSMILSSGLAPVQSLKNQFLLAPGIREILQGLHDLERICGKIACKALMRAT